MASAVSTAPAPLADISAPTPPTTAVALSDVNSVTDPDGHTTVTISGGGVFDMAQIGDNTTIKIVGGIDVKLSQAVGAAQLNNVNIVCDAGTKLHIENLNIATDQDMSIIDFTGAGNSMNIIGDNKLESTAKAKWNTSFDDVDTLDHAIVHVGLGTELSVFGDDSVGNLSVITPDYVRYDSNGNIVTSGSSTQSFVFEAAGIGGNGGESAGILNFYGGNIDVNTVNRNGAAIGGGSGKDGGTINIAGGNITAVANDGAAIGGGAGGNGGVITISGGTLNVTAYNGAAIGGGGSDYLAGDGGTIKITGGTINATAANGAAIGGGESSYYSGGSGGNIEILGGVLDIKAKGGAGIGGASGGSGGNILISGTAEITATSDGYGGACIGGGQLGECGNITITGGKIFASSSSAAAAIGNGKADINGQTQGVIHISGGEVVASNSGLGAAIGNGGRDYSFFPNDAPVSTPDIIIDGGKVVVTSSSTALGAAIGGGGGCYQPNFSNGDYGVSPSDGANLTITGGTVTVNSGWIGGGADIHNNDSDPVNHTNHWADNGTINWTGGVLNYTDPRPKDPTPHPDAPPGVGGAAGPELTPPTPPTGGLILHIGEGAADYDFFHVYIEDMHAERMGLTGTGILTQENAAAALKACKAAINYVSENRGGLGAYQNRLEHTISNLGVSVENITDAESAIRDTDMAKEMMAYTKQNILNQSAQAMLSQANQLPQGVLQLLQ